MKATELEKLTREQLIDLVLALLIKVGADEHKSRGPGANKR